MIFKSEQIINLIDDSWEKILPNVWKEYILCFNKENVAKFKVVGVIEDLVRLRLMEICDSSGRVIININSEVDVHSKVILDCISLFIKR